MMKHAKGATLAGKMAARTVLRSKGSYRTAGQLQQRPSPAGDGIFKRHWFRYFQPRGANLPPVIVRMPDGTQISIIAIEAFHVEEQIQSGDCALSAFKDLETSDYVVGQVWGRLGPNFLLGDQVRGRWDCPATVKAVRELTQKWPGTIAKLIEDKANGSAVIQMLAHEIPGLLAVNPSGGKIARAQAISPLVEAGNARFCPPGLKRALHLRAFGFGGRIAATMPSTCVKRSIFEGPSATGPSAIWPSPEC